MNRQPGGRSSLQAAAFKLSSLTAPRINIALQHKKISQSGLKTQRTLTTPGFPAPLPVVSIFSAKGGGCDVHFGKAIGPLGSSRSIGPIIHHPS